MWVWVWVWVGVLVTHSSLTLCDPINCSPSGSSVHGILQARILEWVTVAFSRGSNVTWAYISPSYAGRMVCVSKG